MYIGIHNPKNTVGGNKGSSSDLVEYLTKEENYSENSSFVNQDDEEIKKDEVIKTIDEMSKGLKKNEAKFFMLSFNPSPKEQSHILYKITGERNKNIDDLSNNEKTKYEKELLKFSHNCMDKYAKNFDREVNGKKIGREDLVYFFKVEYERKYSHESKEVIENKAMKKKVSNLDSTVFHRNSSGKIIESGMKKEGNQSHIHVIVCRYDKQKQTSMSPMSNHKSSSNTFSKGINAGFNRMNFKESCEKEFDKNFEYSREYNETLKSSSNNLNHTKLKVADKEGKVDGVKLLEAGYEVGKFAGKTGIAIATGGTSAIKDIVNVEKIGKKVVNTLAGEAKAQLKKVNPFAELLDKLNVKKQVEKEVKKAISKGGMEM